MSLDSYRSAESKELIAARWAAKKSRLKVESYENKLKNLDPDTEEWEAVFVQLQEEGVQTQCLIEEYWRIHRREM